ncbi:AAA family ATPase [Arthrobacter sp. A5]|uniref:AAA family ATPase n=1 Tax=Arthrobacter sp. A5 TaxID=576926 RepID=UPI003DA8C2D8
MRIAITGAHGVGKTTLTNALTGNRRFIAPVPTPMHNPQPGQLKSLQDCTNEEVLRLTQRRYTERIQQEHSAEFIISDGSVLHEWVYAATRLQYGVFPAADVTPFIPDTGQVQLALIEDFIEEALAYTEANYDEIFFIPVEFPLPADDAPISARFQREAGEHLYQLLKTLNKPVHILGGTVERRQACVSSILDPEGIRANTKFVGR